MGILSSLLRDAKKAGAAGAGMAGYFTGLGPQFKEAAATMAGKTAKHSMWGASAMSAKNLGIASAIPHVFKEAAKGKGASLGKLTQGHSYEFTGLAKAGILGIAGVSAVKSAVGQSYTDKMGQVDAINQAPSSMTYDYDDIGSKNGAGDNGADGGLVFSLNKLRNG